MIPTPQNLCMSAALAAAEEKLVADMERGERSTLVPAPLARPLLARLRAQRWEGQALPVPSDHTMRRIFFWDPAESPIEPPAVVEAIGGRAALEAAEAIALELPKGARRFAVAPPSAFPALLKMFEAAGWNAAEKDGVLEVATIETATRWAVEVLVDAQPVWRPVASYQNEGPARDCYASVLEDVIAGRLRGARLFTKLNGSKVFHAAHVVTPETDDPMTSTKASGKTQCVIFSDGSMIIPDRIRKAINVWTGGVSFVDKGNGIVEMMSDETFMKLAGLHDDGPSETPALTEPRETTDAKSKGRALYPLWFDRAVDAVRSFLSMPFDKAGYSTGRMVSEMRLLCRSLQAAGADVRWKDESIEAPIVPRDLASAMADALFASREVCVQYDRGNNAKTCTRVLNDAMEALRVALPPEAKPHALAYA